MILTVRHSTTYRYPQPIRMLVQSLRLTPSRFDGQRAEAWSVTLAGATTGAGFRDGAGDWTETVSLRGPTDTAVVEVAGRVATTDLSGVLRGHREAVPPGAYLRVTRTTRPDVALTELSRRVASGGPVLARAHALSEAVSDAIVYRPGATDFGTTAAEAMARGAGVCQDMAHALIAVARLAEIPARYVVGYMFSTAAEEASHAWAELWVEGLGWVGFDAANRCCPDERYIRLCSGFDAQDAAPIRGVGAGTQPAEMEVAVAVQQSNQ